MHNLVATLFIHLNQRGVLNAARKAWAEECMMDASDIAIEIRDSQQEFSVWDKTTVTNQL
jgi:hypothetical protein